MLYFVCLGGVDLGWHVGEPLPSFSISRLDMVQADGDELELIFRMFSGLPRTEGAVQIWTGPWAAYIAKNLALKYPNRLAGG